MSDAVHATIARSDRKQGSLRRDIAVVALLTLFAAALTITFEFHEWIFATTRRWEFVQLDELPAVLVVLALALMWFAWRRYREASQELIQRKAAEYGLAELLAENRRLGQQYIQVQEEERRRLARELHDEAGQYLNAIKTDAVAIQTRVADGPEPIRRAAAAIVEHTDRVYGAVRTLIRELRPVGLDDLGLKAALEHYVEQWQQRLPQVRIQTSFEGDLDNVGEQISLAIYRITQEGLTNVARHASASRVELRLTREQSAAGESDEVVFRLKDDGCGVELAARHAGVGLIGMRERIAMLGGSLQVTSEPAHGLEILAGIPVRSAQ